MQWVKDKDKIMDTFCPIELDIKGTQSFRIHIGLSIVGQIPPHHELVGEFSMVSGLPELIIYKNKEINHGKENETIQ